MSDQISFDKDSIYSEGYGIVAKKVMRNKELSIEAKALYSYICSFAGSGTTAFPGAELIINELNIGENRFYKSRKELIEKGYITVIKQRAKNRRAKSIYQLATNPIEKAQHLHFEGIESEGIQNKCIQNEGHNINSIINIKNINNIYTIWNEQKIIVHKKLTDELQRAINNSLKKFTEDEIIVAIKIYKEILDSDFYFNYKWSLKDFLSRKNGISTFMEDGSNYVNYKEWKGGQYGKYAGRSSGSVKADIKSGAVPKESRGTELNFTEEERRRIAELE